MPNVEVSSVLYNVASLYVSPSPATGYCFSSGNSGVNLLTQIPRVQSVGVSFNRPLEAVYQFGKFANIDRISISPPTASINMEYLMVDGKAENALGFNTAFNASMISGLLDRTTAEKNYFLGINREGYDLNYDNTTGSQNVLVVTNAYINNYSVNLAVGSVPKATVTVEGYNFASFTGNGMNALSAIDPNTDKPIVGPLFSLPAAISYTGVNTASALRAGEVEVQISRDASVGDYMSGIGSCKVNSVSMSFSPSQDPITKLGSYFPVAKKISKSVQASFSVDATAGDVAASALSDLRCNDPIKNFRVIMRSPGCGPTGVPAIIMDYKNAKLESRDFSMSVGGGPSTVRLSFISEMGAANDTSNGILFSGTHMWNTAS